MSQIQRRGETFEKIMNQRKASFGPSMQDGTTMSGSEPQFMTPDQVRAAPAGTMFKDDKDNIRRK
jgi:hypothetical protein